MKLIIVILAIFVMSIAAYSEVIRTGDTFKVEQTSVSQDTKTKYTWEDKKGIKYPVYITKNGACYIIKTSKKGKQYKQYLPKDIQETIRRELNITK